MKYPKFSIGDIVLIRDDFEKNPAALAVKICKVKACSFIRGSMFEDSPDLPRWEYKLEGHSVTMYEYQILLFTESLPLETLIEKLDKKYNENN